MFKLSNWRRYSGTFSFSEDLPIDSVTIEIVADDAIVSTPEDPTTPLPIYITDIHFQAGEQLSGWVPETREFLKKMLHTNDEFKNRSTDQDIYDGGKSPVIYKDVEFSEYNIAGRGIEVFTIPNWYPEDWRAEILPTGVDIEITPKDDYDFMRVCTNSGALKEDLYNNDTTHPLSMAYTREFSLGAGKAGQTIKILSRSGRAFLGASRVPIGGIGAVTLGNGESFKIRRRSFFLAQKGATRIRFEFYKLVDGKLKDIGIGYQGTAKFNQWTYGRSKA